MVSGTHPEFEVLEETSILLYDAFLKAWMLSVVLSAVFFGVALALSISCISLLRTMTRDSSKRRDLLLQGYILFMFATSTCSIVSSVYTMTTAVFAKTPVMLENPFGKPGTICMVLANWSADGFLLWRCVKLYEGIVSHAKRRACFAVICLLGLMSLAVGITYLSLTFSGTLRASLVLFAFACTSLFVNLSITVLITTRVTYLSSSIKEAFGRTHVSIYRKIVSMFVESAALVVMAYTAYVVLTLAVPLKIPIPLKSLAGLVPMMSLTQIYVIATLLIVYRVAQGRENESSTIHTTDHGELGSSRTRSRHPMSLNFAARHGAKAEDDVHLDLDDMEFVTSRSKNVGV